jgi:hypothetical protein
MKVSSLLTPAIQMMSGKKALSARFGATPYEVPFETGEVVRRDHKR